MKKELNPLITEQLKKELNPSITEQLKKELNPLIREELKKELNPLIREELKKELNPLITDELKVEFNKNTIKTDGTNNKQKKVLEKNINNEQHATKINTGIIKNMISYKLANSNK